MAVSKQLFGDWKRHPVTEEMLKELLQDTSREVSKMITREVPDGPRDQFVRALVKITDDIVTWEPDFLPEEDEGAQD